MLGISPLTLEPNLQLRLLFINPSHVSPDKDWVLRVQTSQISQAFLGLLRPITGSTPLIFCGASFSSQVIMTKFSKIHNYSSCYRLPPVTFIKLSFVYRFTFITSALVWPVWRCAGRYKFFSSGVTPSMTVTM